MKNTTTPTCSGQVASGFTQKRHVDDEQMALANTKGQPLGNEQIEAPLVDQSWRLIQAARWQGLLAQVLGLHLLRIVVDPEQRVGVGHTATRAIELISKSEQGCVGRLLDDREVEVLMIRSA